MTADEEIQALKDEVATLRTTFEARAFGAERFMLGLAVAIARSDPAPAAFADEVRAIALDTLPRVIPADLEDGRLRLEWLLGKFETEALRR
jgi:hypothetical protein